MSAIMGSVWVRILQRDDYLTYSCRVHRIQIARRVIQTQKADEKKNIMLATD